MTIHCDHATVADIEKLIIAVFVELIMGMPTMKVKVKFYTRIKEFTGEPQTTVELNENSTVLDLMKKLAEKYGKPFEEYVLDPNHGIKPYIKVIAKTAEPGQRLKDGSSVSVLLDTDAFLRGRKEVEIYPIIGGGITNFFP